MRHHSSSAPAPAARPLPPGAPKGEWQTLRALFPYLWQYKWRVTIALSCLILAKVANVAVPVVLKDIVDAISANPTMAVIAVPIGLAVLFAAILPVALRRRKKVSSN